MFQVLAILSVRDSDALEQFESIAVRVMADYGGSLLRAFETDDAREIHVLEFPSEADFDRYRADARLADLADLRQRAIGATELIRSHKSKQYV